MEEPRLVNPILYTLDAIDFFIFLVFILIGFTANIWKYRIMIQKTALVLSGGGVKAAAFHLGVSKALIEQGFSINSPQVSPEKDIQLFVGSSAGSLIAALFAAGYSPADLIQILDLDPECTSDKSLKFSPIKYKNLFSFSFQNLWPSEFIKSFFKPKNTEIHGGLEVFFKKKFKIKGFFSIRKLEKYLKTEAFQKNDFAKLKNELYIVATYLNRSQKAIFSSNESHFDEKHRAQYIKSVPVSEAICASAALPIIFEPVQIKHDIGEGPITESFFDGEIRDTLSTHIAEDNGATNIISSYTMKPYEYHENVGDLYNFGLPMILNQAIYQSIEQKIIYFRKSKTELSSLYQDLIQQLPGQENEEIIKNCFSKNTDFKPNVKHNFIHPRPEDYQLFFSDHLSLKKSGMQNIFEIGYQRALDVL